MTLEKLHLLRFINDLELLSAEVEARVLHGNEQSSSTDPLFGKPFDATITINGKYLPCHFYYHKYCLL